MLTEEQEREIVHIVTSTRENRKKTAVEYIRDMGLTISESRFKQAMYNHGYGRGSAGWKIYLTPEHKEKRLSFCLRYRGFDWVNRSCSSDETPCRIGNCEQGLKWRKAGEELDPNTKNLTEQSHDKSLGQISGMIA